MVAQDTHKGISIMKDVLKLNKQIEDLSTNLVELESSKDHFGGIEFKLDGVVDPVRLTYTYDDRFNLNCGDLNVINTGYETFIEFFIKYLNKKNNTQIVVKNPNCLLCSNWMTTEDEDHSVCEKCWEGLGDDE